MEPAEGARAFQASGEAYDRYMGRYSRPLAMVFADATEIVRGQTVLDVGCGPGALTGALVDRLGAESVSAFDPSGPFVAACAARYPGVDVRPGRAEAIPFGDDQFDAALAQLVLHFVSDPEVAAAEMRRVVHPGGTLAACVWDFDGGMEMLRRFWDAALSIDAAAPDEARTMRFGRAGEIAELLDTAGLTEITETTLAVRSTYRDFDELWSSFLAGIGPVGSYCLSLSDEQRNALRDELFRNLDSPVGAFTLQAKAHCASGKVP
jgi:SAM-dependent methyltransferase